MMLKIRAKPNSKKQEIRKISEKEYIISLKENAENNKANLELLKVMKKYLRKDIKIIKGLRSRNKIIEVKDGNKI